MNHDFSDGAGLKLEDLRKFLDQHSDDEIRDAISTEDFSRLIHLPISALEMLANLPAFHDFLTDIWWYVEIRDEQKFEDFPCIHIAYAMSSRANHVIGRSHGVFAIRINEERTEGIVIGHCPWCAKTLNVSAAGGN